MRKFLGRAALVTIIAALFTFVLPIVLTSTTALTVISVVCITISAVLFGAVYTVRNRTVS